MKKVAADSLYDVHSVYAAQTADTPVRVVDIYRSPQRKRKFKNTG